jgi:DNA-binding CsgD family transcriptional regulator
MQYLSEGGLTTKVLAARIRISPNTVKTFLRSIMLKMGGDHTFWNLRKSDRYKILSQ